MSLVRIACRAILRAPPSLVLLNQSTANIHRWVRPTLIEINKKKKRLIKKNGYPKEQPRSEFNDWNYDAEIYAFGKRLHEKFNHAVLTQAFIDRSYIVQEEMKQRAVGVEDPVLNIKDNAELVSKGEELLTEFVISYLNISLPKFPRDGIKEIYKHLVSDYVLSNISKNLGTKDLILSAEYPPTDEVYIKTFKALIGALFESSGEARAYEFIRDFVCTQLNQVDINKFWKIEKPANLLREICADKNLGEPEPRLIGQLGKNTLLGAHYVGIYANKQNLGCGYGESIRVAVKEAIKDSLRNFFKTNTNMKPFDFEMPVEKVMSSLNKPSIAAASIDKL